MKRRRLLIVTSLLATVPKSILAQKTATIPRIGLLWIASESDSIVLTAFLEGLRALGYVDGMNIQIDKHSLVDRYDRLTEAADRLTIQKIDIIVSYGSTATLAARKATSTIPIIMVTGADPVKLGLVATLSKPGGNVTGVTLIQSDLRGKRLEILHEIVPSIRRIGFLFNPESAAEAAAMTASVAAARSLDLELVQIEIRVPGEIDIVISGASRRGVGALLVNPSTMFAAHREQIVTAIAATRLPAIYENEDFTKVGGLVSYGPNRSDGVHRAAVYVDKILKGAKPGDLPVEQPTTLQLVINLKAANALGLTIPQSLLVRADEVMR